MADGDAQQVVDRRLVLEEEGGPVIGGTALTYPQPPVDAPLLLERSLTDD